MKFLILFALVAVAYSAPQPKKVFHENFEDFLDLIEERVADELGQILSEYSQYDEFWRSVNYMSTPNFKNLVYEMEALPEFRALLDYLEGHGIDITYYIERFNDLLENPYVTKRSSRQEISGTNFSSFINDCIAVLPQAELAALFDQKVADDADFRDAIQGLQSAEFHQIFGALWANDVFLTEVATLRVNGIDVNVLLDELVAIFGQN